MKKDILLGLLWFSQAVCAQKIPYYGAKFEPKQGIIHGAGQSPEEFDQYVNALSPTTKPVVYMGYLGLNDPKSAQSIRKHDQKLKQFDWFVIPQFGLSMTRDGEPEKHYEQKVAAGEYDTQIDSLLLAMQRTNRPVFLRIGYEFNGNWNGYQPTTYVEAFRRIKQRMDQLGVKNVATVWNFAPVDEKQHYMPFYPGDEFVDWWSFDVFKPEEFSLSVLQKFLDDAKAHAKPVMIGESTPRNVGVLAGQKSWNTWFNPYFELMDRNPHIKSFCYISWNWAGFPQWSDWGDGRIGQNEYVRKTWQEKISRKRFIHGADSTTTLRLLNGK